MTETTIYALALGLSVFSLSLYVGSLCADYRAHRRRRDREEEEPEETPTGTIFTIVKPIASIFGHFIGSTITGLQRRHGKEGMVGYLVKLRLRIQHSLVAAGNPEGLTADQMLGVYCTSAAAWTGLGILTWWVGGVSFPILMGFVIGAVHPHMWLRKKITARRNDVRRQMPYALDLLTLSVEAGLDFTAALGRMAPKLGHTALADEFGEVLRQIRLGRGRSDALREMADRLEMPEVNGFCSSLIQADELGADLGPVLRVLSDQMRTERANRAEKKAMEAPVKILFPLIAFIFPTVFIILFAPIGIDYLQEMMPF